MKFLKYIIAATLVPASVIAHTTTANETFDPWNPLLHIWIAVGLLAIGTIISLAIKHSAAEHHKKILYGIMAVPIVLATLSLAGHTIYENITSETKGPIHWHADYQVWTCGERLDLINPRGLNNKIGSPLLHEHNDDRIHIEGTVPHLHDIALGEYFRVIGGELSSTKIVYPTKTGIQSYANGDLCGQETGMLAVYVNGRKIQNPETYEISRHELVPPGDCIIFEFAPNLGETTQKICESWTAKDKTYEVSNGS